MTAARARSRDRTFPPPPRCPRRGWNRRRRRATSFRARPSPAFPRTRDAPRRPSSPATGALRHTPAVHCRTASSRSAARATARLLNTWRSHHRPGRRCRRAPFAGKCVARRRAPPHCRSVPNAAAGIPSPWPAETLARRQSPRSARRMTRAIRVQRARATPAKPRRLDAPAQSP